MTRYGQLPNCEILLATIIAVVVTTTRFVDCHDVTEQQLLDSAVRWHSAPTVTEYSVLKHETRSYYSFSFSLIQTEPSIGQLKLFHPLPKPLVLNDSKVDDVCLVFNEALKKSLVGTEIMATNIIGPKVEILQLDASTPCREGSNGFSFKNNSLFNSDFLDASTANLRIDIVNLNFNLLPETNSSDWFKLLIKTSPKNPEAGQEHFYENWAQKIAGMVGRKKRRELEIMPCGDETSCCGAILRVPTQDLIRGAIRVSNETTVVTPSHYSTMQCLGWCPSRSLHHYVEIPNCRPSKYGNGTILFKRESATIDSHFEEVHLTNWNVTQCSCT